jgi:hypothetical protein
MQRAVSPLTLLCYSLSSTLALAPTTAYSKDEGEETDEDDDHYYYSYDGTAVRYFRTLFVAEDV